jgi:hypothetical protein
MKTTTLSNPVAPKLFATVRASRDRSLVAFAVALLGAAALHLGAFLPRFSPAESGRATAAQQQAAAAQAPAAIAATPVPCAVPKS